MEKNTAESFKMCHDDVLGRHLVATRTIHSGKLILKEPPLVRGPFLHTVPVCLGCGKTLTLNNSKPCTRCGWPLCGQPCEDAPAHRPECILTVAKGSKINITNFGIPHPNYQFVTILRSLYLKMAAPETWERLMRLQAHPLGGANVAPPSFIRRFFKLHDWTEDEVGKIGGILTVNGHELPLGDPPELVVYGNVSLLEHNCRANCTKTFTDEGEVLVIAAELIQPGDHLNICYTDPFWGVQNRRLHLHQTKDFWCKCLRCEDPTEFGTHLNSIKCPNRPCNGFLLPKTFLENAAAWNCDKCDAMFSNDNIGPLLGKIGGELSQLPKGDPIVCKQFLNKYEKILAPNHYYLIDVKMALIHMLASQNFEDLSEADLRLLLQMTNDLKYVAERIAPAEKRFLGLLLYRHAKASIEAARRKDDLQHFRSTLENSKVTMIEASKLLENEPNLMQEGRIRLQIGLELQLIDDLLTQ